MLKLRRSRTLTVLKTGDIPHVIDPGGKVTFDVPFSDKMSDASTKIEFRGHIRLTLYWDGKTLMYFAP